MAKNVQPGDWVRFYYNGRLLIGAVAYRTPRESWESSDTICTDAGTVQEDSILEVRSADRRQEGEE